MGSRYFISLLGLLTSCAAAGDAADEVDTSEAAQLGDTFNSGSVGIMVLPSGAVGQKDFSHTLAFASAGFDKGSEDPCVSRRSGSCVLSVCQQVAPQAATRVDAGEITITGGLAPVRLTPDPTTHGYARAMVGDAFVPGQVLTVRAAGSVDVPPFVTRLAVPEPVTMIYPPEIATPDPGQPPLTDDQKLHISRDRDFELTWSGGTGNVLARLYHFTPITSDRYVTCYFKAADRKGVIPSKFLKFFPQRPDAGFLFELTSESHVGNSGFAQSSQQNSERWHIEKKSRMMLQGTKEILFD